MPISVTCPNCKAPFRLADQFAGKKVKCQKCQGAIDVPDDVVAAAPTMEIEKPGKATQVKTNGAITTLKPKTPKKTKDPDKPAKKKAAAKEDVGADDAPFTLPSKNSGKKAKAGCSALMMILFSLAGIGVLGCVSCAGVGAWLNYEARQQAAAEIKAGQVLVAANDDRDKNADKSAPEKDKKKTKDGAKDAVKKDDAAKDGKKDDALKDGPPVDIKKDDARKDKGPIDPRKDDAKADDPFKDKKAPPPPGILAISLGPDGTYRGDGVIGPDDPISPFNQRTYKGYQIDMQAGMTYQIDLVSTEFDAYLYLLDAKNNKITEDDDSGGNLNARITYQAKTSDTFRIHVSHFDNKVGRYTLSVRRNDPAVVVNPKGKDKDGVTTVVFSPDNIYNVAGVLRGSEPLNKEGLRHHAYDVYMQQGAKYNIVLQPGKTKVRGFRIKVTLRDATGDVIQEIAQNAVGVGAFVPMRTGIQRLEVVADEGTGPYTLVVIRSGAVFVDKVDMPPKGDGPGPKPAYGNVTQKPIPFNNGEKLLDGLIWAADGKSFYVLNADGLLRRIDPATGKADKEQDYGRKCSNLAMSAEGLLISVRDAQEVWVVDPDNLATVKKKISVPALTRVSAGVNSSFAVAGSGGGFGKGGLIVLDLKKGALARFYQNFAVNHLIASADGKYVFAEENEHVKRYRLTGAALVFEEDSFRIGSNPQSICVSPDGNYVCMPSGGGNGKDHPNHPPVDTPYTTYVYPAWNLKRPVLAVGSGAYPMAVGFDPKSGYIFTQNHDTPFKVYNFNGINRVNMNVQPFGQNSNPREFAVSPLGFEVLIRGEGEVVHLKLVGKGEEVPKLEPPPDPLAKLDPKKDPDPKKEPDPIVKKDPRKIAANIEAKDVTHRVIAFKATEGPLRSPVWSADGKAFYVLCKNGAVQRINADTGAVDKTFNIGRGLGEEARLGICAAGLVVSFPGQLMLIDLDLAGIKKKINSVEISNVAVGRDAPAGVVAVRGALRVLDLPSGTAVGSVPFKLATFNMKLGADGKYLLLADSGRILRYRVDGQNLVFEENSPTIVRPPGLLSLSADGKFVCLAGDVAAVPINHPERGLYVYAVEDLKKPVAVLPKIDPGRAVSVDVNGGWIYANESKKPLVIFSMTGVRKGEFPIPEVDGQTITEYVVSPLGSAFLIRTPTSVIHVKIDVAGAAGAVGVDAPKIEPPALDPKIDPKNEAGKSFVTNTIQAGNFQGTELTFKADNLPPDLTHRLRPVWDTQGKSFYVLANDGTALHKISRTGKTELSATLPAECIGLALSSEGLVTLGNAQNEVWLIDAQRLTIRAKIPCARKAQWIGATPASAIAVVHTWALDQVDLKTGRYLDLSKASGLPGMLNARSITLSPDSKYVFYQSQTHTLERAAMIPGRFLHIDTKKAPVRVPFQSRFEISPDSKWLLITYPTLFKADIKNAGDMEVFPITDWNKPAYSLPGYHRHAAFDRQGHIYAVVENYDYRYYANPATEPAKFETLRIKGEQLIHLVAPSQRDGCFFVTRTTQTLFEPAGGKK